MMTWYFDDPVNVRLLLDAADEWKGTPFRKFSRAKGPGDGEFLFSRSDADYSSAAALPRVIHYLRGQVADDPQSARLAELFAEIEIPDNTTNIAPDFFLPGDLLVLRRKGQFHVPVILARRQFINAVPALGVIEGDIHNPEFSDHLIALFRARAKCS
jgi:hypothetical protein